jgi:hypothetical protein
MSFQKPLVGDYVHMPAYSSANGEIIQIFQEHVRVKFPGPVPAWGHPWMVLGAEGPVSKKCSGKFEVGDNVLTWSGHKGVITKMSHDGLARVNCEGPEPDWRGYVRDLRHPDSRIWNQKVPEDEPAPYKDPSTLHARRESFEEERDKKTQPRHLMPPAPPVDEEKPPASPSFVWKKTPFPAQKLYLKLKGDDSRLERFQELDTQMQYSLFSPHEVYTGKLPSVPKDWGTLEEQAVESTISHIRLKEISAEHFGMPPATPNPGNAESSGDDSYAKDSGALDPTTMRYYEDFVRALPFCVSMTIGFFAKDGESNSCYCPCSKVMSNWNSFCSVNGDLVTDDCVCKMTLHGKPCCEFLQHAFDYGRSVCTITERTKAHYIIYQYLKCLLYKFWTEYPGPR